MTTNQTYSNELRVDSSRIIIPIVAVITVTLGLIGMARQVRLNVNELWYYIMVILLSPLTSRFSWDKIEEDKPLLGTILFLVVHMLLLTLVYFHLWSPISPIPYVYVLFVIFASMLLWPSSGFYAWNVGAILILGATIARGELSFANFLNLLPPLILGLLSAVAMYLTALEWQTAVEAVSFLHIRAQSRRDELFATKEQISKQNDRLTYLNQQLDKARQEAINERDIRTRFMNTVSHELRTPLNSIVNFAHILHEGGAGPVTDWQRDYLNRVEQSGWHLLDILNDLLDMAQIEAGEFKLYMEATDLEDICRDAIAGVQGLILEKEAVELITDYPEIWPQVKIDRTRIRQALINLLGNAAKYTEDGHIALRVRRVDGFVEIVIEDTGIGIAPEHHEIIFEEFRQIDETAARKRIGTGLGLPITKHLVERHGGTIRLESATNQGSKFIISLPIHAHAAKSTAEANTNGKTAVSESTAVSPPPALSESP